MSVPLRVIAEKMGIQTGSARRYILRLGFEFHKKRDPDRRNTVVLCLTEEQEEAVLKIRRDTQL